jgi:hypothetical protein
MTNEENVTISNEVGAIDNAAESAEPKKAPPHTTEPAAVKPSILWIVVPILLIAAALFLAR